VEVWQTSSLRRVRLGEEKKKEQEETTGRKYNGLPYSIGRSKLECGPTANVMAALYSTPQSLADTRH